jgi:hypothetical protein
MTLPDSRRERDAIAHHAVEPSGRASVQWWHGWSPLVLIPGAVVLFAPPNWPRWVVMWSLAFAIYCGCKWLTWRRTPLARVPTWRRIAYLLAWPGLNAAAFLREQTGNPPHCKEWMRGARNLVIGLMLFWQPRHLLMLEFPSLEQAERWYDSPEYKPLIAIREKAARTQLIIAEGT